MRLHCFNVHRFIQAEGGGGEGARLAGARGQLVLLILVFFCNELRKAFYSNAHV